MNNIGVLLAQLESGLSSQLKNKAQLKRNGEDSPPLHLIYKKNPQPEVAFYVEENGNGTCKCWFKYRDFCMCYTADTSLADLKDAIKKVAPKIQVITSA